MNVRAVSGMVCGLVTAGAIGAVLGSLGEYQVPDYADQDVSIGLAGTLVATIAAVVVIAGVRGIAGLCGAGWPRRHVVVPLVLVPAAVLPLVLGAERNRLEAALIWGAAAVAVHLMPASAGDRRRRWTAAGLVLSVVAGLLTWSCQHRWRAQKFEAVGLPLAVPEVPGFRLTGTWAGRYSVGMALRGPSGRRLSAVIRGPGGRHGGCGSQSTRRRLVPATGQRAEHAVFCLRDDAVLVLVPGTGSPGVADLLPGVMVREVDGSVLADHPDDTTMSESD